MSRLLLLLLAASPLDTAKDHLKAGRLDDVLFALDGQTFSDADKPVAAQVLGDASLAAFKAKDELLALQFAQTALKLDPKQPHALEGGARAAFKQQQFEPAEKYADRWLVAEPGNGSARVLRAQLAVEAGEWDIAVDQLDQARDLKGDDAAIAKSLKSRAQAEINDRKNSLSALASLSKKVAEAAVAARRGSAGGTTHGRGNTSDVIVYSTSWCGYCKKTKAFLSKKGVSFTEKDVERDPAAAEELAQKAAAAGLEVHGVPVTDVRGKLIMGFDQAGLESAL